MILRRILLTLILIFIWYCGFVIGEITARNRAAKFIQNGPLLQSPHALDRAAQTIRKEQ